MIERRAGVEFRVAGRTLTGVVARYGDVADLGAFRERIEPGAFSPVPAVPLILQHDTRMEIMAPGDYILNDGPRELSIRADLPADSAALALVRRGKLQGYSFGMRVTEERREAGVRVVRKARLSETSLCDAGAYPQSRPELRARSGRRLRSRIPYDEALACECIARRGPGSGAECIPLAKFAKNVGEEWAETFQIILGEVEDGVHGRDVLAVAKDYGRPLGSVRRKTLRMVDRDDGMYVEVDLPSGAAGDDTVAASETAGVIVRPLVDDSRSEFTDGPDGREYQSAHLRAFLVGSTDARGGWPDVEIDYDGQERRVAPAPAPRRRRWWWL